MLRQSKKVYINNGTLIRPDWTDRIAISWFPDRGHTMPSAVTYTAAASATGSDIVPDTYNLTGVSICKDYWEFHDPDGTYSTNNAFCTWFYATQSGDFRYYINKTALGTNESNFYIGRNGSTIAGCSTDGVAFAQRNETGLDVTLNDTALVTYNATGYATYARNVIVTDAVSAEAIALNEKITAVFDAVNVPPIALAENRVYIEELGCYFGGSAVTAPVWTNFEDLRCDWTIKKSDIMTIQKQIVEGGIIAGNPVPDKYSIVIKLKDGKTGLELEMGQVANKTTWVATAAGLNIAFEEVQSWIV